MFIKKIIAIIVLMILVISISQTVILGSYPINKKQEAATMAKSIIMSFYPFFYKYGFDSNIYFNGNYNNNNNNKVDIVISNHINTIDFCIYLSLIREFDSREIYLIAKKDLMLIPGLGFILAAGNDIKLNRKLDDDYDNIVNSVKKITNGIIIIMPEGTRFTEDKKIKSQQYSKDNNLPIFNNILYPKMKGLHIICNALNDNNKLGNIIDITCMVENFKNKNGYMKNLLFNKLGNSFANISTYSVPIENLKDYELFKKWFLVQWNKKDKLLETMSTNLDNYTKLNPSLKSYEYMIIIVLIILFFYLLTHMNGFSLPISLIISFLLSFIKYKKLNK
jgi:lysocardiolipin and lysophospholipid acyltransferase